MLKPDPVVPPHKQLVSVPDDTVECPICGTPVTPNGLWSHASNTHSADDVRAAMLEVLAAVADDLGHTPTTEDLDAYPRAPSHASYGNWFGSYNDALRAANLEVTRTSHGRDATDAELLEHLRALTDELGHPPSSQYMDQHGRYSATLYKTRWGSWSDALAAADVPTPGYSRAELREHLRDLGDTLCRPPSAPEVNAADGPYHRVYQQEFGSWIEALLAAGFDVEDTRANHGVTDTIHSPGAGGGDAQDTIDYGPGFDDAKKRAVRERDGRECQRCGLDEDTHLAAFDRRLPVHHIEPARTVEDPRERNDMPNLVTVCVACHTKIDTGHAPNPDPGGGQTAQTRLDGFGDEESQ
jgi:hypothetical protein